MDTLSIRYFSALLLLLSALHLRAAEPSGKSPKLDRYGDPLPPLARLRIGTTRFRHGGEIIALAFAPDGRSIATLGRDDMLCLWDKADGKKLASLHAPEGVAIAFGEGGKALLWCDARGQIYRCDAGPTDRRRRIHKFDLESSERIDVAVFTADGSAAVAGSSRNTVYFWGRKSELQLSDGIHALALDREGNRLAVNNGNNGIRIQAVNDRREARGNLRSFGAETTRSLAFSPDGRLLAAGDFDNRIRLWDANMGREVRLLQGHRRVPISGKNGVFCLAFSPDGKRLASGAADGLVRVWDVQSGKELAHCAGHGERVRALAFAADGQTLASAGADNALRLWEPATGRAIGPTADEGGAVLGMSVSADGKTLALVQMPGQLRLWEVATGKELPAMAKLSPPIAAAVFTPKGRTLVIATVAGRLHFWDCDKNQERQTPHDLSAPIRLLAANDGPAVAWCGYGRRVVLWDAAAGKEIRQLQPPGNRIADLKFSPDGDTLLVASSVGVRLFAIREMTNKRDLVTPAGGMLAVAVSPDGRMAATGGQDGVVRLWEIASGKQRRALFGDTAPVHAAAFSADGTVLATGSRNGLIRLWDVSTGQRLHSFAGHRGTVVAVAFAAGAFAPRMRSDSRSESATLITAGVDGTALIWDLPALLEAGRSKVIELSSQQVQALWRDLASADAAGAYEAVETLARAPAQAVPFLRRQVTPASAEKLARRIKELDSDDYTIRIRSMSEIAAMGTFAKPALRKLITEKPSLEARRRAEELLALLDNPASMTEHLRVLRTVEVLERIGTQPALEALRVLADGAAEAALTREANAALTRRKQKNPG